MRLTAGYRLTAAVNPEQRRITGRIVPFGEEGTPGLDGERVRLIVEPGGLVWGAAEDVVLRLSHHTQPIGRAVTLDAGPDGIVGNFRIARTQHGDDALVLAAEQLVGGLSIEADTPPGFTADRDGIHRLTADNPAQLRAVALVESAAFASAAISDVAAATVDDQTLTEAVAALQSAVDALTPSLPADDDGDNQEESQPMSETTAAAAEAVASIAEPAPAPPLAPAPVTAATAVTREPFPYGHPGAEGRSLFRDIVAAGTGDSLAAARAGKAHAMLSEHRAGRVRGASLEAANEPIVRSTLVVPNVYDVENYVESIKFPRVIADSVPGVSIDAPNPIVVPAFTSFLADGGAGEPVVASTEGNNPAQAELNTTPITVTPVWYTGLADVSRQAVDAAAPGTDALIMRELVKSYMVTTEAAAVTAILANGTAGTDSATNADTAWVEPVNAQAAIRKEIATMYTQLGQPADAVLFAPDVYLAAVGATNSTSGNPLYAMQSERYQLFNQAASAPAPGAGILDIYGIPGRLAFALPATKFVVVNWSAVMRWESPLYEFRLDAVQPANYRFAVGGYFAQRTLQAKGVRYFAQA